MSLRFLVYASDPARRDALRELLAEAGHELVDSLEAADVVLVPARDAGFAAMREHDLQVLLTPREMEVLSAIADGLGNKMIARRLNISLHTVKFHIESLFRKLGVRTRTEALASARERRLKNTLEL
jgi:ATP/maltotriose-dependent transcriptional regulator MalT